MALYTERIDLVATHCAYAQQRWSQNLCRKLFGPLRNQHGCHRLYRCLMQLDLCSLKVPPGPRAQGVTTPSLPSETSTSPTSDDRSSSSSPSTIVSGGDQSRNVASSSPIVPSDSPTTALPDVNMVVPEPPYFFVTKGIYFPFLFHFRFDVPSNIPCKFVQIRTPFPV